MILARQRDLNCYQRATAPRRANDWPAVIAEHKAPAALLRKVAANVNRAAELYAAAAQQVAALQTAYT